MLDRIMVGYDGSEESDDALALAGSLAAASDGRLLVTRVFEFGPFWAAGGGGMAPTPGEIVSDYEHDTIGHLESVAERIGAASEWVISDSGAHGLHAAAEREEVDLVVVGSSHRGALGQILPGSTGFRLLHGAPCPVAVAPRGMRDRPEAAASAIVVAFDGRDEARRALDDAYALAEKLGARVHLVAIAVPPLLVQGTGFAQGRTFAGTEYDVLARAEKEALRESLDEAIAAAPGGVEADAEVSEGDPVNAIVEASADADLLVLGSRGYGPLRGVLLGSVSMDVLRRATCPVMVVPRGSSAAE